MNKEERENWEKVKVALEEAGKTDSFYYKRAVAICKGKDDPLEEKWK
jgi:hypothetical protein